MENSFHEIKKRDEAEYIKRVQQILEKSKMEEENELISNKKYIRYNKNKWNKSKY